MLEATPDGICSVRWIRDHNEETVSDGPAEETVLARGHLTTCTTWLSAFFNGTLLKNPVPKPPIVIPKKGDDIQMFVSHLCTKTRIISPH